MWYYSYYRLLQVTTVATVTTGYYMLLQITTVTDVTYFAIVTTVNTITTVPNACTPSYS